jgi:hypothetical protein
MFDSSAPVIVPITFRSMLMIWMLVGAKFLNSFLWEGEEVAGLCHRWSAIHTTRIYTTVSYIDKEAHCSHQFLIQNTLSAGAVRPPPRTAPRQRSPAVHSRRVGSLWMPGDLPLRS